ncbi:aldose epimerase family protein [Variovorax sp. J22P271]|uniref:aldose epimerase family protein n=1 Tax=Variovorax davisae TaxID=3053515 RepID=UPI00257516B1|nr:aldose epimerase family protein [Variovorax sp. J22P271]MDM0034509.1 aldose epimerase family protein [Variovorax sp. J22P271]
MNATARIVRREFGTLADGRQVFEYTLDNGAGLSLSAINLGGIVTSLRVPDRHGRAESIVLGLATLADYETRNPHFGTIVGRHANRIAHGRFSIDGEPFQLALDAGSPHALHGGPGGFGRCWWDIEPVPSTGDGNVALALTRVSADGEQGYPGRAEIRVLYTLTADNAYRIDYEARSDRATIVNLTHHDYFNLAGQGSILGHRLTIPASRYCPVDERLIPEGIAAVAGTPFDFRSPSTIGERIRDGHPQLLRARGYDHNWVLDPVDTAGLRFAARLADPVSGRVMDIETTEPGLQFYSGNFLDGSLPGATGQAIRQGDGLCLETQHFPDAPNQPGFPSTLLRPGEIHSSTTVHRFGLCAPHPTERTS